jgi:hypothetical protein
MSSSQSDDKTDKHLDALGTSFSELLTLEVKADEELQQQSSSLATRYSTTGSDFSRDDRIVTDYVLGTSISPEEPRNDFSRALAGET